MTANAPRTWVLLRGLSRERRQWGRFAERLARGATVHTLDLPGIGDAMDRVAPTTVSAMAEDLEERLEQLEPTARPYGLLGASLGGMIALAWTAAHPSTFDAAVVVNASAGRLSGPLRRLRPGVLPVVARAVAEGQGTEQELITLGLTTSHRKQDRALAAEWAAYRAERPVRASVVARQLVAGLRFRAPERLEVPTLFVSGARDRFVHPSCTARLAEHYRAPHRQHPTAGHDLAVDAPEWLVDVMTGWTSALKRYG